MKRLLALAAITIVTGCAGWSTKDKVLLGSALTLQAADWSQTKQIAKQPEKYSEVNPFLGKHPSVSRVNNHFVASMISTTAIAHLLPEKYRTLFLGAVVTVEALVVGHNASIGLKVGF